MNTGEIWRGVADRLEQMIEEQDEALREAPEYEHTYSVYLELVTHFRGEIEQLRKERHTMCIDYERVEQERDEARRVARRLYATNDELIRTFVCNPIATWRKVYENSEQNGTTGVTQPSTDGN